MELTLNELKLADYPGMLRTLAEMHDMYKTNADAADLPDTAKYYKNRAAELRAEASRIENYWLKA